MRNTDPSGLFDRAERIRLPIKDWAAKAGVSLHTLLRIKQGKNHLSSSVESAAKALEVEEAELRRHLDEVSS